MLETTTSDASSAIAVLSGRVPARRVIPVNKTPAVAVVRGTWTSALGSSVVAYFTVVSNSRAPEKSEKEITNMKVRFLLIFVAATVAVAIVSTLVTRRVYGQSRRTALTYEQLEKLLTGPDTYGREQRTLHAVRGDGSSVEVRLMTAPDGRPVEQRMISDLGKLKRVTVEGHSESVTTYRIDSRRAAQLAAKPRDCSANSAAPRSSLLGYEVVLDVRELARRHDGSVPRVEAWRATALDCLALEDRYFIQREGKEYLTNLRQVTSVRLGEPDTALFEVPASYAERAPSEVMIEYNRRFPSAKPESPSSFGMQHADRAYRAGRPR